MTAPPSPAARGAGAAPWIAAGALAIVAVLSFRHGQDFLVFWRGARRLMAGSDLFPASDGFLAWRYAPGTAILFSPFTALPFPLAKAAWYALVVGVGALVVRDLARAEPDPRPAATAALALAALSRPLVEELACGQVNLVVLLALLLAFRAEDSGRPMRAGLIIALAVGLKLAPAVFLIDAALRRRWRVLAGAGLGGVAIALAPLPFHGPSGTLRLHVDWVLSLAAASPGTAAAGGNQSVFGLAARLGVPAWWAAVAAAAVVVMALRGPALSQRRSSLLFATAFASPMGWIQNYVAALPAMFTVARTGRRYLAAAVGLSLLVPMYDVSGPRFEHWFFDHSLPLAAMALFFALSATHPAKPLGGAERGAPGRLA